MADYSRRHHAQVQVRKLADPVPPLNSFRKEVWRKIAEQMGAIVTWKHSKAQIRAMIRKRLEAGVPLPPPGGLEMTVHTLPTVHLNGTSRDELVRQLVEAGKALQVALDKLRAAYPHERDYYVNPDPMAYKKAKNAHDQRCREVHRAMMDCNEMAEALAE